MPMVDKPEETVALITDFIGGRELPLRDFDDGRYVLRGVSAGCGPAGARM